jgi:hypothetical protein
VHHRDVRWRDEERDRTAGIVGNLMH